MLGILAKPRAVPVPTVEPPFWEDALLQQGALAVTLVLATVVIGRRLLSAPNESVAEEPSETRDETVESPTAPTSLAKVEGDDTFKGLYRQASGGKVKSGQPCKSAGFIASITADSKARALLGALMGKEGEPSEAEIEALFKEMDTNGNGELEWAEWTRYEGKQRIHLLQSIFKSVDPQKGRGTVAVDELVSALSSRPMMLEILDLNGGSGATVLERLAAKADGKASWEDLKTLVHEAKGARLSKPPSFIFAKD